MLGVNYIIDKLPPTFVTSSDLDMTVMADMLLLCLFVYLFGKEHKNISLIPQRSALGGGHQEDPGVNTQLLADLPMYAGTALMTRS